jgi:hypothetical protein
MIRYPTLSDTTQNLKWSDTDSILDLIVHDTTWNYPILYDPISYPIWPDQTHILIILLSQIDLSRPIQIRIRSIVTSKFNFDNHGLFSYSDFSLLVVHRPCKKMLDQTILEKE